MRRVIVVGDANVDIIVPFPKFLKEDKSLVEYPTPCLQGGGTSANTAVALSRLGVPTEFIGSIGDDQYGHYIQKDFQEENVDTEQLIVEPDLNTVGVFAFIDETGERYLWGWPRVDQAFKVIDDKKVDFNRIRQAAWVHSSGMSLVYDSSARSTIIEIFKEAFQAGIPTSFDLNLRVDNGKLDPLYKKAILEIIQYSNYVLGSAQDEYLYLGDSKNAIENARSFVAPQRTIIVRRGCEGSMGLAVSQEIMVPAFSVEVVDTVGAGDVYNAGFIATCLNGGTLKECLRMGNAVSGYTVNQKGSRNCPHTDELDAFLKKYDTVETE